MRSLEQIIADNGGDNTPALDTHNLTGRVNRTDMKLVLQIRTDTDSVIKEFLIATGDEAGLSDYANSLVANDNYLDA